MISLSKRVNIMKNRVKTILIPLVSVSLLCVATASHANSGGCDYRSGSKGGYDQKFRANGSPDSGMKVERMARRLDLSDAQQNLIKEIIVASSQKREALHQEMHNNRDALQEAMTSDDAKTVRALADQKGDLMADLIVLRSSDRSQIKAVLTPEQQKDFSDMKGHKSRRR